jgi:hypothetical protein
MRTLMSLAVVLTLGSLTTLAGSAQQDQYTVSAISFADSPLTVAEGHAVPATPQRVASVSWEVTNVSSRHVSEYMVRVYVYRATGETVGFRTTRLPVPVAPGKSGSAFVKFPGEMEVRPSDLFVIVITKAFFEDGTQWDGPDLPAVRERVQAEVARLRGVAAAQPSLQHAAFVTPLTPL